MIRVRKTTVALALAACGILMMGSCTGTGKKDNGAARQEVSKNLKFVSYNYDFIAAVDDSVEYVNDDVPGSRFVRYSGEGILPEVLGDENVRVLRDSLQRMAGMRFENDNTPEPVVNEGQRLTDLPPASTETCGICSSGISTSLVNPRLVTFSVTTEIYECMAAHGMNGVCVLNYDVTDGKILRLNDMIQSGKTKVLVELVRNQVKEAGVPVLVDIDEIELPDQFEVTSAGIDFIYQPYDIAPYSEGVVRVSIPLGDLLDKKILSPSGKYLLTGERPAARN